MAVFRFILDLDPRNRGEFTRFAFVWTEMLIVNAARRPSTSKHESGRQFRQNFTTTPVSPGPPTRHDTALPRARRHSASIYKNAEARNAEEQEYEPDVDMQDAQEQHSTPAYVCPFLDPIVYGFEEL
jgi:hypothetical protein